MESLPGAPVFTHSFNILTLATKSSQLTKTTNTRCGCLGPPYPAVVHRIQLQATIPAPSHKQRHYYQPPGPQNNPQECS